MKAYFNTLKNFLSSGSDYEMTKFHDAMILISALVPVLSVRKMLFLWKTDHEHKCILSSWNGKPVALTQTVSVPLIHPRSFLTKYI